MKHLKAIVHLELSVVGIPSVYYSGVEGNYFVMVMDLLDESLDVLYEKCGKKFSLNTVKLIAIQLVITLLY
jgi:casein kinase 1